MHVSRFPPRPDDDRVTLLEARVASLELLVRSLLLFGGRAPEVHDRRSGPGLEGALASLGQTIKDQARTR